MAPALRIVQLATARYRSDWIEVVTHMHLVNLESVDGIHLRGCRRPFKPGSRAPAMPIGHSHQSVLDRILMDVGQTSQVRLLEGQPGFPVIEPDLPADALVELVHVARCTLMQ